MKRDMELIRSILLAVEEHEHGFAPPLKFDEYSEEQVGYHNYLIVQGGLADGIDVTGRGDASPEWIIRQLTWQGHEFIDAARDPSTWEQAKRTLAEAGKDLRSVTLGILQSLLTEIIRGSIGV